MSVRAELNLSTFDLTGMSAKLFAYCEELLESKFENVLGFALLLA